MTTGLPPFAAVAALLAVSQSARSSESATIWTEAPDPPAALAGSFGLNSNTAAAPGEVDSVCGVQAVTVKAAAVLPAEVAE
jgi:hypothetical protein